jgi:hypothetical protein
MRLNYYEFPESVDAHTRFINGASSLKAECLVGGTSSQGCPHLPEDAYGCKECPKFHCIEAETVLGGISVTEAKKLLRVFGGNAWTEHCERDGGVFEVTEIKLQGNNSRFKYNRHL